MEEFFIPAQAVSLMHPPWGEPPLPPHHTLSVAGHKVKDIFVTKWITLCLPQEGLQ